jgi:hypothetical protein
MLSKRNNIMKSVMKDEGQVAVKFDLMYDQEEGLFNQMHYRGGSRISS